MNAVYINNVRMLATWDEQGYEYHADCITVYLGIAAMVAQAHLTHILPSVMRQTRIRPPLTTILRSRGFVPAILTF